MAAILTGDPNPELSFDNTLTGFGRVIDPQIANSTALITVSPSLCPLDLSGNGIVDADDIFAFLSIWFAAPPGSACITPPTGCPGDWNNDGLVSADDIFAFLNAWFAFGPGTACP